MVRGKRGLFFDVVLTILLILAIIMLFAACMKDITGPKTFSEAQDYGKFDVHYQGYTTFADLAFRVQIRNLSKSLETYEASTSCGKNVVWSTENKDCFYEYYESIYTYLDIREAFATSVYSTEYPENNFALSIQGDTLLAHTRVPIHQKLLNEGRDVGEKASSAELEFDIPENVVVMLEQLKALPQEFTEYKNCCLRVYDKDEAVWKMNIARDCRKDMSTSITKVGETREGDYLRIQYELDHTFSKNGMPKFLGQSVVEVRVKAPEEPEVSPGPDGQTDEGGAVADDAQGSSDVSDNAMSQEEWEMLRSRFLNVFDAALTIDDGIKKIYDLSESADVHVDVRQEDLTLPDDQGRKFVRVAASLSTDGNDNQKAISRWILHEGPNGVRIIDQRIIGNIEQPSTVVPDPNFRLGEAYTSIPSGSVIIVGASIQYVDMPTDVEAAYLLLRDQLQGHNPQDISSQEREQIHSDLLQRTGVNVLIYPIGDRYRIDFISPTKRYEGSLQVTGGQIQLDTMLHELKPNQ